MTTKEKMTAAEYIAAHGWDFTCIEATAQRGVSEADVEALAQTTLTPEDLLAYCRERIST